MSVYIPEANMENAENISLIVSGRASLLPVFFRKETGTRYDRRFEALIKDRKRKLWQKNLEKHGGESIGCVLWKT